MVKKEKKDPSLEEMKTKIYDEIHDDVVEQIKGDVTKVFDEEFKEELKLKLSEDVENTVKDKYEKEEKRLCRKKSFKIFRLYIYIIVLVACSVFLIYKLYKLDGLGFTINGSNNSNNEVTNVANSTTGTTTTTHNQEWYIKEYGDLVNNVIIDDTTLYKGKENFTSSEKLSIAYHNLEEDAITSEDGVNYLEEESLKKAYKETFGTDDFENATFEAEGISYVFSKKLNNTYIGIGSLDNKLNTLNKVVNIKEDGNDLIIETIVAKTDGENIYNVFDTENSVVEYDNTLNLTTIQDKLTTVKYIFQKIDDNYYFKAIR